MAYGKKRFRKTFGSARRHSRRVKKARFIRRTKRFVRTLNRVAEKKMVMSYFNQDWVSSLAAGNFAQSTGMIVRTLPVQGTESYNRVGSQIFIRYLTVKATFSNTDSTHYLIGQGGFAILYERNHATMGGLPVVDLFSPNGYPCNWNATLLKERFKKMKLKIYYFAGFPDANGHPYGASNNWNRSFTWKFKIMKNCQITNGDAIKIPDIFIVPFYFPAPISNVNNQPTVHFTTTMTFTDV